MGDTALCDSWSILLHGPHGEWDTYITECVSVSPGL